MEQEQIVFMKSMRETGGPMGVKKWREEEMAKREKGRRPSYDVRAELDSKVYINLKLNSAHRRTCPSRKEMRPPLAQSTALHPISMSNSGTRESA